MSVITPEVRSILICPACRGALADGASGYRCDSCAVDYTATDGKPDLRLRTRIARSHTSHLGTDCELAREVISDRLEMCTNPEVDFTDQTGVPFHFSKELLSYIPKAKTAHSKMIDIGCGDGVHQGIGERAGFSYVGIDYGDPGAPMFADGHCLPFADESFEFAISMAVFEHIRHPYIAMSEAFRVLEPGGLFLGSIAFLEPFHGDSYYHHTHLGTVNSLAEGGFEILWAAPNREWNVLAAQADMALFPRMPGVLAKLIMAPVQIAHRAWWKLGGLAGQGAPDAERVLKTSGSFFFLARKPAA